MAEGRTARSDDEIAEAVAALRELILTGEHYRLAAATHLGISITDSQAVSYLMARGEMGQHELAEALGMTTGSVTSVIDRLVARGFVERRPHFTDRRRWIVQLSEDGNRSLTDVRRWMVGVFDGWTSDAIVTASRSLRRTSAGLRDITDSIPEEPLAAAELRPRRRR